MSLRNKIILVVEDNFPDFILVKELLLDLGIEESNIVYSDTLAGINVIAEKQNPDVVLLDLGLPDSDGIHTFDNTLRKVPDAAFILLSGLNDRQVAIESIKRGAQDYLVKGEFDEKILHKAIDYAIERKRIHDALHRSEERYKYLINTINEAILMTDSEFELIYFNEQFAQITGIEKKDLIKKTLFDLARELMDEQNRELFYRQLELRKNNKLVESFEIKIKNKKDQEYWLLVRANVMTDQNNDFLGEISAWVDISPIKKAKEELLNAVLEAQEKEKSRIARDLHDHLGQLLAAAQMNFNSLDTTHFDDDNRMYYTQIKDLLNQSIKDVRTISHNLMPMEIEHLGFAKTIELLVNRIESGSGIQVKFFTNQPGYEPPVLVSTHLYRIIQEFISNAIKHGQAKEVDIEIDCTRTMMNVYMKDDGRGFDTEAVSRQKKGIGLTNMFNRISMLNSNHRFFSAPGEGTLLEIEIPK